MSWIALIPVTLFACTLAAWWFTEPKTLRVNLIAVVGCVLFFWAIAPVVLSRLAVFLVAQTMTLASLLRVDAVVLNHVDKFLTAGAVFWLLRRSWQTLWKPVPELIGILGVDVPDAPDVSLAGIRADAAVLNWSRAQANKPVEKFLIQVNGVVVGDVTANQDPAIQVMGLKPNHFYNVRVIAVGANNFQAGSRVIRLRTFGSDGRPELGDARLPSNFRADEPTTQTTPGEHGEENGQARRSIPSLETTSVADAQAAARDPVSGGTAIGRRNTVTRRHSPSTTSLDQPPIREDSGADDGEASVQELTRLFDEVRKEIDDNQSAIIREEEESKQQHEVLEGEKQERKREQKSKEEQTERLRRDQGNTDRSMRTAQQRRSNREKQLRDKKADRVKAEETIVRLGKEVEDMKEEQQKYRNSRTRLEQERREKLDLKQTERQTLKDECVKLESELKDRRERSRELNEARKSIGGEEDAEWQEQDTQIRREWQHRQRAYQQRQDEENRIDRKKEAQIHNLTQHMQVITQSAPDIHAQASTSIYDSTAGQFKRRSRHNTSVSSIVPSPLAGFAALDAAPQPAILGFSSSRLSGTGFAQAPYMDFKNLAPVDEASLRVQSVPLSPSAAALVPRSILDDDDQPGLSDHLSSLDTLAPLPTIGPEDDPQSPASSGRSLSIISSPHGSSQHLPFPPYLGEGSERLSVNNGKDSATPFSTSRLGNIFSPRRLRGNKGAEDGGPTLGSLKSGQSQSFPRQTDDQEAFANKRRISLSATLNVFNRNSAGPGTLESIAPGSSSRIFSGRGFHFPTTSRVPQRDPGSPRPGSMASSEHLPRPSTDSGSIWGAPDNNSALARPWMDKPWSRNPSRRPSIHGSPSVLKTTLADAEDEILDQEDLSNASQVGVIGSRPRANLVLKLNPAATPFLGNVFRSKLDKDKDKERDKEGSKGKEKGKAKEKDKSKEKGKEKESKRVGSEGDSQLRPSTEDSPADSRKSKDALSVHTQTSISVSESHDSLSLDRSVSNTPSEPAASPALGSSVGTSSVKEQEKGMRKLFRKGSSSKFGLPGRLGGKDGVGGGLFKKGPSSIASASATSDRNIPHSDSGPRSSMGDAFEDASTADELSVTGLGLSRTIDSATSSPALGPMSGSGAVKIASAKDGGSGSVRGGSSRWFSIKKKGKADREKDSLEMDRREHEGDGLTPTE